MTKPRIIITVKDKRMINSDTKMAFQILQVTNTTVWRIGEFVDESILQSIINNGTKVVVK